MTERKRPNPSFCVLTLGGGVDFSEVNAALLEAIEDEEGRIITPLGNDRFVLARPVSKKLLRGRNRDQLFAFLKRLHGVESVSFERADVLRREYSKRPAVAAPAATPPVLTGALVRQAQWNLNLVKAPAAWKMFPGALQAAPWQGIRVGHIDTGYTEHPVLGFAQHTSCIVRAHEGINFRESESLPLDPLGGGGQPGHGTRTMSILCGHIRGVFLGVAPSVTVIPYRISDSVAIDFLGNETAFDHAVRHAVFDSACDVISVSLGDPCFPPESVGRQVDAAYEEGVIFVSAAGNITSEVTYPGRYHRTIAAGGVTKSKRPWSGGSRGRRVDICAPADNIYRATVSRSGSILSYDYGDGGDGTSYATVHVAGAAALWLAYHGPNLNIYGRSWKRVEAFRQVMVASAEIPPRWNSNLFGAGVLNIAKLLAQPLPDPSALAKSEIPAAGEIF